MIDLYSRRLLGASVGLSPNATLARQALQIAVTSRGGPDAVAGVIFGSPDVSVGWSPR
ncbi:MAG TPA: hypothetical protein VFN75_03985 [Pseudonocardiaceae bacterium]|nr:hypothetical protein [Pseudonocardiaceae bacterium]